MQRVHIVIVKIQSSCLFLKHGILLECTILKWELFQLFPLLKFSSLRKKVYIPIFRAFCFKFFIAVMKT